MSKFENSKKKAFLENVIKASIESENDNLITRCKFNFSYMDFSQEAGQEFRDWIHEELIKLLNKIHDYCRDPLSYWKNQQIGKKSQHVLEVYGTFPKNSGFKHPVHVPHEVHWARFRLESEARLIGFVLPPDYHNKKHPKQDWYFDCNTFYVVFLDAEHKFYKTDK